MTEKRFTDIEHDYENARIRCKDNGMFMLYAIYKNDDGLPTLGDLLNEQEERIKKLESENKMLKTTISRNEAYINQIKTIGKWNNTGGVE